VAARAGTGASFEGKASKVHATSSPLADRVGSGARGDGLRAGGGSTTVTASHPGQTWIRCSMLVVYPEPSVARGQPLTPAGLRRRQAKSA
jgi:hypothetical protein